ncbi:MAG: GNAT family N-acetyltransferase [Frankia sp.]|nr:GNAT family N-acetyltransferase [Frankia sp.]
MSSTSAAPSVFEIPTLVTDRLILRAWRRADLDPYAAMNADPLARVYQGGPIDAAKSFEIVVALMGMWTLDGHGMWALELRSTGEFVGRAGLYIDLGWPGVEVAWTVRRDLWNQGLATEAGAAAITWGWEHLDVSHLFSVITPGNLASRRVAEKLGFHVQAENADVGPWRGQVLYRLDRPDGA